MTTLHLPQPHDTFELYMSEIRRFPLLSRSEEQELALRWKRDGDRSAAQSLVCANLRFVVKIAQEYRGYGLRLADLVQEGNIGLMLAVKKFDPERGIRLISYAVWWIRAYIQNYILRSWSLVKIGTTQAQKKLFFKLAQAREKIRQLTGGEDTGEIAGQLGVGDATVVEMAQRMHGDLSLDHDLSDGEDYTLLDTLVDERINQEEALIARQQEMQLGERVATALQRLNEREQRIVHDRILADEPRTLQELADDYGITRERVRQLEQNALKKLKGALTVG